MKWIIKNRGVKLDRKELEYNKALLKLGFKFITRDINGDLKAWKERPRRIVYYMDGYLKRVIEKFGEKDTIYIGYEDSHLGDQAIVKVKDGVLEISHFEMRNIHKRKEYECLGIEDNTGMFSWLEWDDDIVNIKDRIDELNKR